MKKIKNKNKIRDIIKKHLLLKKASISSMTVITIIIIMLLITFTNKTTKVLAYNLEEKYDVTDYVWLENETKSAKNQNEVPIINSKNAIIYDRTSKTVIYGKKEDEKVPMASTTKIMTAIILLESISDLNQETTISKEAARIGGSRLGLKTGDKITYNDLLYGLMLCSGNDAATQIALDIGGSIVNFANIMNRKAGELGLKDTHFITPHGLDNENHYTTAKELAIITDYALENEKFKKVVSTKRYIVNINGYRKEITNTNELLGYIEGVNGVKTGFTGKAGRCLVTSVDRNNFNIIVIVLGADTKKDRTKDSIKLIEYTYKNFELIDLRQIIIEGFDRWKQINEKRIYIYKGRKNFPKLDISTIKHEKYPILKEEKPNINIDINSIFYFEAPLEENLKIGEIKITLNATEILCLDILNKEKIERKSLFFYIKELFLYYKYIELINF